MGQTISVIVPLAPGETKWTELIPHLVETDIHEVLLATGSEPLAGEASDFDGAVEIKTVRGGTGRAGQMNVAAGKATGEFIWFVHADTRLDADAVPLLQKSITQAPECLHYFDLAFDNDGPVLMGLNALGVRVRSDLLKMPFGDQAFCLQKQMFFDLGMYDEEVRYGEDHLLVWKARHNGVHLKRIGGKVHTSARKYRDGGWFQMTLKHLVLTAIQAVPQWIKLMRSRLRRS